MSNSSPSSVTPDLDIVWRVFKFNRMISAGKSETSGQIDPSTKEWLTKALEEELQEFREADTPEDLVDALIDLIIFACGGLYRAGLTPDQAKACFTAVLDANDAKKAGVKQNRAVAGVADAVKPTGWVDPKNTIAFLLKGK